MLNTQNYINQSGNKKHDSKNDESENDDEIINEIRNLYNIKN
jgi:hypothetical protein